jgi:hypothetical protein
MKSAAAPLLSALVFLAAPATPFPAQQSSLGGSTPGKSNKPSLVSGSHLLPRARAEVKITGDTTVKPWTPADLTADYGDSKTASCIWKVTGTSIPYTVRLGKRLLIYGKPGVYQVTVTVVDFDAKTLQDAEATVTLQGDIPPAPVPPPGPNPPPGPTPPPVPVPPPTPNPAPIPLPGFRVLILYDSATLARLPKEQLNVLYDKSIRDYLNSKCAPGPAGNPGKKDWRIWDAGVDAAGEGQMWVDALKRPHASLPWLLISTGATGYEGPLPGSVADTLALLKKYGG